MARLKVGRSLIQWSDVVHTRTDTRAHLSTHANVHTRPSVLTYSSRLTSYARNVRPPTRSTTATPNRISCTTRKPKQRAVLNAVIVLLPDESEVMMVRSPCNWSALYMTCIAALNSATTITDQACVENASQEVSAEEVEVEHKARCPKQATFEGGEMHCLTANQRNEHGLL